ncbi:hypothetical protein SAMN05421770_103324 [Granulicella rosea]|uniref:Uncharacterized protein n=1 Tax=Granulicella rosea TaxID=474952 RepID=A0A239IXX0_9BACT|nr:hypothetical protein [Granulicella rosea]SNS98068.1 hypothetical protein SAMN05421770_103324 [Granulicella rosea]
MRFLQSVAAGTMTVMIVAFGMIFYLFNRVAKVGGQVRIGADLVHTPVLLAPLVVAFVLGFGLGWWNLRPE